MSDTSKGRKGKKNWKHECKRIWEFVEIAALWAANIEYKKFLHWFDLIYIYSLGMIIFILQDLFKLSEIDIDVCGSLSRTISGYNLDSILFWYGSLFHNLMDPQIIV